MSDMGVWGGAAKQNGSAIGAMLCIVVADSLLEHPETFVEHLGRLFQPYTHVHQLSNSHIEYAHELAHPHYLCLLVSVHTLLLVQHRLHKTSYHASRLLLLVAAYPAEKSGL